MLRYLRLNTTLPIPQKKTWVALHGPQLFLTLFIFLIGSRARAQDTASLLNTASMEAAPSWTTSAERAAPQLLDLVPLFQSLRHGESDEIFKGVLLCNVQVTHPKRWDSFAAPDLNVTLSIGKGAKAFRHVFRGPQDRSNFSFSLPLVSLPMRTKVGLSLTDRDVFQNEFIGSDVDIFAGAMPLVFNSGTFTGECRSLFGEALRHQISNADEAAQHLLRAFTAKNKPNAERAFLGLARERQVALHRQLVHFAALTGWQDDRLQRILDEENAFVRKFHKASKGLVQKIRKEARKKKDAIWVKDRLRISQPIFSCDSDVVKEQLDLLPKNTWSNNAECIVLVEVEKRTGGKTTLPPHANRNGLRLLQTNGHVVELQSIGFIHAPRQKVQKNKSNSIEMESPKAEEKSSKKPDPKMAKKPRTYARLSRGEHVSWILVPKKPVDGEVLLRVPGDTKVQSLLLEKN